MIQVLEAAFIRVPRVIEAIAVRRVNHSIRKKPYVTRVKCNPLCKLDRKWAWSYCDPEMRRIVFVDHSIRKKPYVTRVKCNPLCKLDRKWAWSYCDPEMRRIVFVGSEPMYSKEKYIDYELKVAKKCRDYRSCKNGEICLATEGGWSEKMQQLSAANECWPNPFKPPKTSIFTGTEPWKYISYLWALIGFSLILVLFCFANGY
uniref:Domain of unknown function DX domain-containing protein n=1 Tax=Caenorhabditis japonica TaxID=281687 RepID=A0A8R1HTE7_CAEJA